MKARKQVFYVTTCPKYQFRELCLRRHDEFISVTNDDRLQQRPAAVVQSGYAAMMLPLTLPPLDCW